MTERYKHKQHTKFQAISYTVKYFSGKAVGLFEIMLTQDPWKSKYFETFKLLSYKISRNVFNIIYKNPNNESFSTDNKILNTESFSTDNNFLINYEFNHLEETNSLCGKAANVRFDITQEQENMRTGANIREIMALYC